MKKIPIGISDFREIKLNPQPLCVDKAVLFDLLGEEEFWRTVYGKSWNAFLQNPSQQDRFNPDFSHASFLRLIQVPSSWSQSNVKLVVNGEVLPARQYCRPSEYRRDQTVLVPDWKM